MGKKRYGSGKRYADILTILLVITIAAILALLGYFGYKVVDKKNVEATAANAMDEFLNTRPTVVEKEPEEIIEEPTEDNTANTENPGSLSDLIDHDATSKPSSSGNNTSSSASSAPKVYIDNKYEVKGVISIPKTNCNYPILDRVTTESLKKSVAILDVVSSGEATDELNVPGTNAFILGHNYRNGQFFSDNYKLVIGDKIKITDQAGVTVEYTIYKMYYTSSDDASFMERQVDPNTREITLQTCNDDSSQRLIIQAHDK